MSVLVVTDSAATLPDDLVSELGIVVVPLRVNIGTESKLDEEVPPELLLKGTEDVTTSGPTPADFLEAIEVHAESDGAIIATVSHAMGASTFLAARAAAGTCPVPVRVVDTETAAGGQGLVVVKAAEVAREGGSLDDVEETARRVSGKVRIVATLPGLDHLARSGHVPAAAAWAARWVGLRPVIELRQGRVLPLAPALNADRARRRVVDAWARSVPTDPGGLHVAGLHSLAEEEAQELLAEVRRQVAPATCFVGSFGTGMLIHSGPGVVGLAWWWET